MAEDEDWIDDEDAVDDDIQIDEYDLTSTPNDFNTSTIFNFIESGSVKIPGFQRHYVWDLKRASKLVESLIIGLPVPQVFLYEERRNSFLVIDGQQRLMTIYYFVKRRFPKKQQRGMLRDVFDSQGRIPDEILCNDEFFEDFNLRLTDAGLGRPNKFNGLNYATLGDYKTQFDLRTIRNVVVKQIKPSDNESSVYEIFIRLNTGGVNLTPQEIRLSLFHSKLYELLFRLNLQPGWRRILDQPEPDLHMRDIEIMLRSIALWIDGATYAPSMVQFLNRFSRRAQVFTEDDLKRIEAGFMWFLEAAKDVAPTALKRQARFSIPLFEALFSGAMKLHDASEPFMLSTEIVESLRHDAEMSKYSSQKTTDASNVRNRRQKVMAALRGTV
jgi:hypothetical protein